MAVGDLAYEETCLYCGRWLMNQPWLKTYILRDDVSLAWEPVSQKDMILIYLHKHCEEGIRRRARDTHEYACTLKHYWDQVN